MTWALGLRIFIVIGMCLGVFGATYWVGSQLRQVGALREEVAVKDARIAELAQGQHDLRTEIKALSASVSKRDKNNAAVATAISELSAKAKGYKNACDDEPLDPGYVERLRDAAAIAAKGTAGVPGDSAKLPRANIPASD